MELVFLVIRVFFGGWCAWIAAKQLSPYGRARIVAETDASPFVLAATGLAGAAGGVCIITGFAVQAGVVLVLAFLLGASRRAPSGRQTKNLLRAAIAVLMLTIERPWPFALS